MSARDGLTADEPGRSEHAAATSGAVRPVACYLCGAAGSSDDGACRACGAGFQLLCGCGGAYFFDESRCGGCGAAVVPRRHNRAAVRAKRVGRWVLGTAVVLSVGGVAAFALRKPSVEPWRLREDAIVALGRNDHAAALRLATAVTEAAPSDARAWLIRGVCEKELGLDRALSAASVARAAELDPTAPDIARAWASARLEAGDADGAARAAERALAGRPNDRALRRLHATACLGTVPPRWSDALASLVAARDPRHDDPALVLITATTALGAYGELPRELQPPVLSKALADAARVAGSDAASALPPELDAKLAVLLLGLRRPADALAAANRGLARPAAEIAASPSRTADLGVAAVRAALALGDVGAARKHALAALAARPDARTAGSILAAATREALGSQAEAWIEEAAARSDPEDGLGQVLAAAAMRTGRWERAEALAKPILSRRPADAALLLLAGDLCVAGDRNAEALALYDRAADAGAVVLARVRRTFVLIRDETEPARRQELLAAAIGALRPLFNEPGRSAEEWDAMSRLSLAAGHVADAVEQAHRAVLEAPWRADLQCGLATSYAAEGSADAWTRAFRALAVADALDPSASGDAARRVRARFAAGDPVAAMTLASAALQRRPLDAELLALRGRCHRALGSWAAAAADFRRVTEIRKGEADASIVAYYVEALSRAGDAREAAAALAAARPKLAPSALRELEALAGAGAAGDGSAPGGGLEQARRLFESGDSEGALRIVRAILAADAGEPGASLLAVLSLLDGRDSDAERLADAQRVLAAMEERAGAASSAGTPAAASPGALDLARGRVLLAAGRAEDAVPVLTRAAAVVPDEPVVRLLLGEALVRTGEAARGLAEFRRAVAVQEATRSLARHVATRLAVAASALPADEREPVLLEALRVDRSNPAVIEAWIAVLLRRRDFAAVIALATEQLAAEDALPAWTVRLRWHAIRAALCTGEFERAAAWLSELPAAEGDTAATWTARGVIRRARKDLSGALDAFERAAAIAPEDPSTMLAAAQTLLDLGRADDAARRADVWSAAHDGEFAPLAFAELLSRRGDVEGARQRAEAALARRPGSVAAASLVAALLAGQGEPGAAVERIRACEAVAAAGDRPSLELLRGRILAMSLAGADEALEIARRHKGTEARVLESEALAQKGDLAGATAIATELLSAKPPPAGGLAARLEFVLGDAEYRAGRPGAAADRFAACLEADPRHANAANNLAWIWHKDRSRTDQAARLSARAAALAPGDPNVWSTHAVCAAADGDRATAERAWRKALLLFSRKSDASPAARADAALRFAKFLVTARRASEAKSLARDVLTWNAGPDAEAAARKILAGSE